MLKPDIIPRDEDIKTIAEFVKQLETEYYNNLSAELNLNNYENILWY